MEAETRILWIIAFLSSFTAVLVKSDSYCGFFEEIPKGPWHDQVPVPEDFEGLTWSERPLIPAPHRDDICMGEYQQPLQNIFMEEEINGSVVLARINYDGDDPPTLHNFLIGNRIILDPSVERIDGVWHLVINGRQDYEFLEVALYMFDITVSAEPLTARVRLVITNIDDNQPFIHITNNCLVEELGEPRLTDCEYRVTDADGQISIQAMNFVIGQDDDQVFDIHQQRDPGDWFAMNITIAITTALNFESNALHIFTITALDSLPNMHTVTTMVQVVNVEHRPPRWVEIWSVQTFEEKTEQVFPVRAIDGDTGIEKAIYYRLDNPYPDLFHIETLEEGHSGALFHVEKIDRDELEQEVFQLSIIAYKFDNESFYTAMPIVIIVEDVNDNLPLPLQDTYHITILEEMPRTLDFDEDFGFHDRDLGDNARYDIHLESVYPEGAAEAFYVAPLIGYQRQTLFMTTQNHSMLDYEIEEFRHIELRIYAVEVTNSSRYGVATIYIDLENWNDELPMFNESITEVQFNETEGEGFFVGKIEASDRDYGDWLTYSLLGNALTYLTIDDATGDVHIAADGVFDYHRQNELSFQVQIRDNLMPPYHTTTSQLVVHLDDVNNTPPTLRLPQRSPEVEENVPEGHIVTSEITGTDPDTTAHLIFEINWDDSYATKQGRLTPPIEYRNCVEIVTEYPDEDNKGDAIGHLIVNIIRDDITIDYEEFEMLYLFVRVYDIHTEIGDEYNELLFPIIIIDMNDNRPLWVEATLQNQFRVRETSPSETVIGSVMATDIDGPLYNQIRYSIYPRVHEGVDTPPGLVKIDPINGELTVDTNEAIDADVPKRWYLHYTVKASDECSEELQAALACPDDETFWETCGEISIHIIDSNNKIPEAEYDMFDTCIEMYENETTGYEVVKVFAHDLDRDDIYHTLNYRINFQVNNQLSQFFQIDPLTGSVLVNYTGSSAVLDRDHGDEEHEMFIIISDNVFAEGDGNINQGEDIRLRIVLLDVNDNAPEMPSRDSFIWDLSESMTAGETLDPDIYAPDADKEDTDNSRVSYNIISLTIMDREIPLPTLFEMRNVDNKTGEIDTVRDLQGYWGTYEIFIEAYDHGIPRQSSNETYDLVIRPYNFHRPVFDFPPHGTTVRLARDRAFENSQLVLVNGIFLDRIAATDEDGLHAGTVDFTVSGNADAEQHFTVVNDGFNMGTLQLIRLFDEEIREFQITILAEDRGTEPGPLQTESTITIIFVPTQGYPFFTDDAVTVPFMEFEEGLDVRQQLPFAVDDKNHACIDDCYDIYYHIIDGNAEDLFALEPTTNILRLNHYLDRTESEEHVLTVAATNTAMPPNNIPASVLTVTVDVREANPRPRFVRSLYTAGISTADNIDRHLFTVEATHTENKPITYSIDFDSMNVDDTLSSVSSTAFNLHPATGAMLLRFRPNVAMHGMFEFDVVASDGEETDRTEVKIFIISSRNSVTFNFVNNLTHIQENTDFIAQTFSAGFGMQCNIDQVTPATDNSGAALDHQTDVYAHFIRDDVPVAAEEIEQLRSDTQLLRNIQTTLSTMLLNLGDFVTGSTPDAMNTDVTIYILAVLSAVLVFMCVVLLLTYFFRTRALNRRLKALSTTKFGSLDSGLNRAGIAYPGTNKHTTEGSNPIWNETIKAPNFDAISEVSGDSDLIGIEDMPQFNYDINGEESKDIDNDMEPSVSNHSNNFGFNASPFSPQFTNRPMQRYDSYQS